MLAQLQQVMLALFSLEVLGDQLASKRLDLALNALVDRDQHFGRETRDWPSCSMNRDLRPTHPCCIYIYMTRSEDAALDRQLRGVAQTCFARKTRALGRAVSGVYREALQSHGLKVSQLNLLVAVGVIEDATPAKLGSALNLEKSTLSRNLDRLVAQGWVTKEKRGARGSIARGLHYVLTRDGRALLRRVLPDWRVAQRRVRKLLGPAGEAALDTLFERLPALGD